MKIPNQSTGQIRFIRYTKWNKTAAINPSQDVIYQLPALTSDRTPRVPIPLDLPLAALVPSNEWGCEGLFCKCKGGKDSAQCKIVAPYCVDDIDCVGDNCSCIWGGDP
ncbi:MAG: hypothetical protein F6K14_07890 [Symploca sp. SIO2C1]|nr:hypothetical protein [Symploca sp. SIO2C1]